MVVVDDSALVRSLLAEIINRQPDMQCVGAAADPLVAREMIRSLDPDVITLDVEMPRMDGLDFLSQADAAAADAGGDGVHADRARRRGDAARARAGRGRLRRQAEDRRRRRPAAAGRRHHRQDPHAAARAPAHRATRRAPPTPGRAGAGRRRPSRPSPLGRLSTEKIVFIGASTGGTEATKERADGPAGRRAGGRDHPAHAAPASPRSYAAAARRPVPHPREGGDATASACCRATPTSRPAACTCASSAAAPTTSPACGTASRSTATGRRSRCCSESAARVVGPNALGVMLTGMGADGAAGDAAHARRRQLQPRARTKRAAWSSACRARRSPPARRTRCCRCAASPRV